MVRVARAAVRIDITMKGTNKWHHRRGDVWEDTILGVIVGRVGAANKQETRRLTEVRA